jgi:hypothetical protein
MNRRLARTCGARARAGTPCQRQTVHGRKRCRLHGGLSPGAPRGLKNGNYKTGEWTNEAIAERRWLRSMLQDRHNRMSSRDNELSSLATNQTTHRNPPVRIKLMKPDAFVAQTAPPDGAGENWWKRLNAALGTMSDDFVNASLLQIQAAARSPFGKVSETAINGALAMIEAAAPRNELEGALAVQYTHTAAMSVLAKMDSGFGSERRITAFGSTAARLMKAYAMQLEVLRRHRGGGQQFVRVEHVHINAGGQAIIGNVRKQSR